MNDSLQTGNFVACFIFGSSNVSCLFLQVYTSGKGSSAAGLTVSVTRDPVTVGPDSS